MFQMALPTQKIEQQQHQYLKWLFWRVSSATHKLHADKAAAATILLTGFFGDVKTTIVTNTVAATPPKNALTNDNCSATATI